MAIDTLESYTYVRELRPNDHPMIKRFNKRFKVDDKAFWCATFYSYGWSVFGVKVYDITATPSQVAGWRTAKTKKLVWSKYWSGNTRIVISPRPMDAVIMVYSHIEAYKAGNLSDKKITTIGGNTTGGNKGKKQGVYIAVRSLNGREVAYIYNHFTDYYSNIKYQWSQQMSF